MILSRKLLAVVTCGLFILNNFILKFINFFGDCWTSVGHLLDRPL